MRTILIGGAWPYANGPLHIGHIASLLPGDVLARYHRAAGDRVCYVSGSDCHGTPVALRAKQEGRTPQEVSDFYHEGFVRDFEGLGFSYDAYLKTSSPEHRAFVQEFHKKLYESGYVYEKETPQAYCSSCNTFLADRFVTGKCPHCGADARATSAMRAVRFWSRKIWLIQSARSAKSRWSSGIRSICISRFRGWRQSFVRWLRRLFGGKMRCPLPNGI